jgi:hypothetical protein
MELGISTLSPLRSRCNLSVLFLVECLQVGTNEVACQHTSCQKSRAAFENICSRYFVSSARVLWDPQVTLGENFVRQLSANLILRN